MILVDTSVWADHLRSSDEALTQRLRARRVLMHPYVLGEIALGHLSPRAETLATLAEL